MPEFTTLGLLFSGKREVEARGIFTTVSSHCCILEDNANFMLGKEALRVLPSDPDKNNVLPEELPNNLHL